MTAERTPPARSGRAGQDEALKCRAAQAAPIRYRVRADRGSMGSMDERDDRWREDDGWWDSVRTRWDKLPSRARRMMVRGSIGLLTYVAWSLFNFVTQVPTT
jgi:hypothetical protein